MNRTILYSYGGGRLGNQLLNYANLLAFSVEWPEFDVFNLAFLPYVSEYGNENLSLVKIGEADLSLFWRSILSPWRIGTINQRVNRTPLGRVRNQLLHFVANACDDAQSIIAGNPPHIAYPIFGRYDSYKLAGEYVDQFRLDGPASVQRLRSTQLSALAGFGVRCWPLVERHEQTVRERLQPGYQYRNVAESYVSELRQQHDTLVGVLIRQGDYRQWKEGRYFFESEQYQEWMQAYAATRENEDTGFLIASDETQDPTKFDDKRYHFATGEGIGSNHFLESFVELSLCDLVLTPPSTFAVFAAFLGDIPIVPLTENSGSDGWEHLENNLFDALTHPSLSESVQ